ncbi:MAG TPA: c-type cytochrome [Anaerolineales bacterium]|nr:c-type cytochrome [Anaerolineales bacterium]
MAMFKRNTKWLLIGFGALLLAFVLVSGLISPSEAASQAQSAADGQALFESKCIGCHTIGGGHLIGPDLQGVTQRRNLDWIRQFISAPGEVIASGDPIASQLLQENNNLQMPNLGLSPTEVDSLLAYLENPDQADQASSPAPQPQPSLSGDVAQGLALFAGTKRLQNGGPGCIACHTLSGAVALGGGSLGPDLTQVYQRYGDAGLASALNTIPFPTMQGVFLNQPLTPQEQANLHALFKWAQTNAPPPPAQLTPWLFAGIGLLGALVLFGVMVFFWPRQRQSLAERLRGNQ